MDVTVNFTNQKRLDSRNFTISTREEGLRIFLNLDQVDLSEYAFPSSSKILLEVFKKNKKTRIPAGTVGDPHLFSSFELQEFSADEGFNIRARVVSSDPNSTGLLLGFADRLKLPTGVEEISKRPLLRVRRTDTGSLVWRFSVEDGEPILEVSKTLGNSDDFLRTPFFTALVLPEFVRRVAEWLFTETVNHAESKHHENWLRFLSLNNCDLDVLDHATRRGSVDQLERAEWSLDCANSFATNGAYLSLLKDRLHEEGLG